MDLNNLPDNITLESLDRNGFRLLQLKDGFRYGTDMTLLAWFTTSLIKKSRIKSGNRLKVLELGSNTGAGSMLLCARFIDLLNSINVLNPLQNLSEYLILDDVEINEPSYKVLCENIDINGLCNTVTPVNSDLRELPEPLKSRQYDLIFFNPPFFNNSKGPSAKMNSDNQDARLSGRFEEHGSLDDFISVASKRAVPDSGYIALIMQAGRLSDVLTSFKNNGIKPTLLLNIHPFSDKNATMFMVAGKKTTKMTDFKILPPLILNEKDNLTGDIKPSKEIDSIYNEVHKTCFI